MPRTPIAAGNWKMNGTNAEARALCRGLAGIEAIVGVDVVLSPSFTQLPLVWNFWCGTEVHIAGQNMHTQPSGAYTGEISPAQLAEVADWVILGHSERRQFFCEDDQALALKLRAAEAHRLTPILCVGESQAERENRRTSAVLTRQVSVALGDDPAPTGLVIAYEPVWAIGTGQAATPDEAETACAHIRSVVANKLGAEVADSVRILYGGSVNAGNIADFMSQPDVDGALVGGASLKPDDFLAITRAIAASA
ncbi:MAG: triose-phosphate isomerase [Chloroflexi bacterium]|nr:triose-phosphate isomerase [Chloroflexota bacterium]MYF22099.1 triose-phosphate isomerase [Chloroflexota bacterium]